MNVTVTVFAPGSGTPVIGRGELRPGILDVTLHDGRTLAFALDQVDAKLGGASGTMIFLVARDHGSTATVDAKGFPEALRVAAGGALDESLAAIAKTQRGRRRWDRILAFGTLGVAIALVVFVVSMPRLLRASVDSLPRDVDRRIGDAAAQAVANDALLANDPLLDDAVRTLLARLEPHVAHDGFVYRTRVVSSSDVNAFALPGGQIVVCAGLLARAERPEAVAGVLAHEIAHVTERHSLRSMAANMSIVLGLRFLFGNVDFVPSYAQDGALLAATRGFSRAEEREADTIGVSTLLAAHVDPSGLADVFRTLSRLPGTEMPGMLAWMSTHPGNGDRIANIERLAREAGPQTYLPFEGVDWPAVRAAADRVLALQREASP